MSNPPEPCVPHSKCWCEQHPNNPNCTTAVPIDNNIFILVVVGLLFALKRLKL